MKLEEDKNPSHWKLLLMLEVVAEIAWSAVKVVESVEGKGISEEAIFLG